jgi:hypothetical protein
VTLMLWLFDAVEPVPPVVPPPPPPQPAMTKATETQTTAFFILDAFFNLMCPCCARSDWRSAIGRPTQGSVNRAGKCVSPIGAVSSKHCCLHVCGEVGYRTSAMCIRA